MAVIYRRVKGRKIEQLIAMTAEVQDGLKKHTNERADIAHLILTIHRHAGDSFIEVVHGRIDYYIVLNDMRGQKAAMTIEFGRKGGGRDTLGRLIAPSQPVAPLRKSVSLL